MSRKPLIGRSGGSGRLGARDRRDSQASAQGESFLFPIATDDKGRVGLVLAANSPHYIDPQRGLAFRVDPNSGFEVSARSPFALRRVEGGNVEVDPKTRALVARPSTDDVRDAVGASVTALLQREHNVRVAADQALDARVVVLEGASATSFVKVSATLVFDGGTTSSVAVTGETAVATAMKFSCMVSSEGLDDPLEALIDEVQVSVGSVVDGDGFTVYGYAPNGSNGTFIVHVVGI